DDERIIVGVNKFTVDVEPEPNVFPIDPSLAVGQIARLKKFKENRDQAEVTALLEEVRTVARGTGNLLIPMKEALRAHATLGEVSDALRDVFGTYQPGH
ncbi:MAG: methylmalonyl-CoA mutase, partial [Actinobacteria bacterium]|nr:methylmalonyl-CoA mutase [Actinomycetota bacterium]